MINTNFDGIKIAGIAAAVSDNWESISDVLGTMNEEDRALAEKFTKNTGVKGRYNAGKYQTTSDFCYAAAKKILEDKNIDPKDIGILVFVTQTHDYPLPATACVLQDRLGLSQDCIAFDVNLGCSGFSHGISIVSSLMKNSNANKALLLCGDTSAREQSHRISVKHSNSARLLFGDSGTATLLEKDENAEPFYSLLKTDGSRYKAIIKPYGGYRNPEPLICQTEMDGVEVFTFSTREVPELINETMKMGNYNPGDYDCLVLHQANLFIMKQIMKKSGFTKDQLLVSIDEFGNTSSSSIPITLVKYQHKYVSGGGVIHAMCCGFGVGLSWSTLDIQIDSGVILPLIHTDEFFRDGYTEIL